MTPQPPRARVKRCKTHAGCWLTTAHAAGTLHMSMACSQSWHEAMQAAYAGIAVIERQLMDEVHASRASRRAKANPDIVTTGEPA